MMNKRMKICLATAIIAEGIFIPWFNIIEMIPNLHILIEVLTFMLIGLLVILIAPMVFIAAQIISIISYASIFIKHGTNKIQKKWIIVLTILLLPNIIFYKDVYLIYHSVLAVDWWGHAGEFVFRF